jgi:hypothetical protein
MWFILLQFVVKHEVLRNVSGSDEVRDKFKWRRVYEKFAFFQARATSNLREVFA